MSTKIVTVHEAKKHLVDLIALIKKGDEVVIVKNNKPVAKLGAVVSPPQIKKRVFGQFAGKIWIKGDFDEPLPADFLIKKES